MKKTKVIILGGGFGGVYAALRLDKTLARRADVEVTLVSSDQELFVAEVGLAQSRLNELLSLVQLYKLSGADGKKISVTGNRRKSDCTMQSRYFPAKSDGKYAWQPRNLTTICLFGTVAP